MNKQRVSVSMFIKGIRGSAVHASLSTKRENLTETDSWSGWWLYWLSDAYHFILQVVQLWSAAHWVKKTPIQPVNFLGCKLKCCLERATRGKKEIWHMYQFNLKVRIRNVRNQNSCSSSCIGWRNSDKGSRQSLRCCNYNGLHWPSVSGETSASGGSSIQNTNATISVTQQQEVGCP